jgi:hypothetical protein
MTAHTDTAFASAAGAFLHLPHVSPAQACPDVNEGAALAQSTVVLHTLQHLVHACCSDGPIDAFHTLTAT